MKTKLLLVLLSVLLFSSGWIGWSGLGLLVAFVPLLTISAKYGTGRRGLWRTFGWVALTFGLWSAVTTGWLAYTRISPAFLAPLISIIATIILFGGIFILYHYVSKRAPKLLAYTLLVTGWITIEYLYTIGEISFPWLTLGNGFGNDIKVIQWYELTGVFGGSLWVLIVNILLFEALRCPLRKAKWIATTLFLVVPIVASLVHYYIYREPVDKVMVTLL